MEEWPFENFKAVGGNLDAGEIVVVRMEKEDLMEDQEQKIEREELKPCPFCHEGADGLGVEEEVLEGTPFWWVTCSCCDARGPLISSEGLAIKLWNTRGL